MSYPYAITPYIQTAMAQAMNAIVTGGPLPPNCFIVAIPMEQAQQVFPQIMMNYVSGGGAMPFSQPSSYYGQLYQPQIAAYSTNQASTAIVPYTNYYSQGYNQNYNYPMVPYLDNSNKSKRKNRHGKNYAPEPHSNVYSSTSFDTEMENLSWSRLFGHHHTKNPNQKQHALSYEQNKGSSKQKQQNNSSDSLTLSTSSSASSSSTTSDETIRRVNVSSKQSSEISTSKQQIKGSLPFKYSSEFVPGTVKQPLQKSHKKTLKVKPDDVFIVKKTPSSQSSSQQ